MTPALASRIFPGSSLSTASTLGTRSYIGPITKIISSANITRTSTFTQSPDSEAWQPQVTFKTPAAQSTPKQKPHFSQTSYDKYTNAITDEKQTLLTQLSHKIGKKSLSVINANQLSVKELQSFLTVLDLLRNQPFELPHGSTNTAFKKRMWNNTFQGLRLIQIFISIGLMASTHNDIKKELGEIIKSMTSSTTLGTHLTGRVISLYFSMLQKQSSPDIKIEHFAGKIKYDGFEVYKNKIIKKTNIHSEIYFDFMDSDGNAHETKVAFTANGTPKNSSIVKIKNQASKYKEWLQQNVGKSLNYHIIGHIRPEFLRQLQASFGDQAHRVKISFYVPWELRTPLNSYNLNLLNIYDARFDYYNSLMPDGNDAAIQDSFSDSTKQTIATLSSKKDKFKTDPSYQTMQTALSETREYIRNNVSQDTARTMIPLIIKAKNSLEFIEFLMEKKSPENRAIIKTAIRFFTAMHAFTTVQDDSVHHLFKAIDDLQRLIYAIEYRFQQESNSFFHKHESRLSLAA